MKSHKKIALLLVFCTLNIYVFSQKDCKVLMPHVSETYKGKCKKGLAHGKGTATGIDTYKGQFKKGLPDGRGVYTWSTGEVYSGQWLEGMKHGEGKLVFRINDRDSTQVGIWEEDVYKGPKPKAPYTVLRKINIDRFSLKREADGKSVKIDITQNGMANTEMENFTVVANSGTRDSFGKTTSFDNVVFPFSCKINYKTWNKLRTSQYDVTFEFEINQPGEWKIALVN